MPSGSGIQVEYRLAPTTHLLDVVTVVVTSRCPGCSALWLRPNLPRVVDGTDVRIECWRCRAVFDGVRVGVDGAPVLTTDAKTVPMKLGAGS